MKKDLLNSISVKVPCTESWDEMIGNNEVRFCSHCAKNVHNLSAMTRAKAEKLVKDSNGKLCVRYVKTPQGNLITNASSKFTQIKRRTVMAAGVLTASLTISTLTYAQGEPIVPKQVSNQTQEKSSLKMSPDQVLSIISGVVKDQSGAVIPNAQIILRNAETGKIRITRSNDAGLYEFKGVEAATYEIEISQIGFKKLALKDLKVTKDIKLEKELIAEITETIGVLSLNYEIEPDAKSPNPVTEIQEKPLIKLPQNPAGSKKKKTKN